MKNAARTIDLNVDAGESFGVWRLGDDAAMFGIVTSANVACGFHAGDARTMASTVREATARGVAIGAHPSYPDLVGFGRRSMRMSADEIASAVVYQVGALEAIARANGATVTHVKPHGALYNDAAADPGVAAAVVSAMRALRPLRPLRLFALAGSVLARTARDAGVAVAEEAFCDRAYGSGGSLVSRDVPGSVITDPQVAARQAVQIVTAGTVRILAESVAGVPGDDTFALRADTLCVHGDTPGAVAIAGAVRRALEEAGIGVEAMHP